MALTNRDGTPNIAAMIKLGVLAVAFLIILPLFFHTVSWKKVEGNEVMVEQHLTKGVLDGIKTSGTHVYCGWLSDMYLYDIGTQKITFDNDNKNNDAEWPAIQVEVGENGGQKASVIISCNYRLNPLKVVALHKQGLGKTYETVILKREIVDTVNEIARPNTSVLDIYSGKGFVNFKNDIDKALKDNTFLKEKGIEVENTIVYGVRLDPAYEAEIAGKQIAQQQALRKQEETKAAQEEAKKIFAQSQAEVEKARQVAEAQKITQITAAEASARQEVLKAEAEKQRKVLDAEGQRDANLAQASGILAVGEATAKVEQLKRDAMYAGEAGARRASVEIAGLQADKLKGMLQGVSVIGDKALYNMGKATGMYTVGVDEK